jgi:hypothetical protein
MATCDSEDDEEEQDATINLLLMKKRNSMTTTNQFVALKQVFLPTKYNSSVSSSRNKYKIRKKAKPQKEDAINTHLRVMLAQEHIKLNREKLKEIRKQERKRRGKGVRRGKQRYPWTWYQQL